MAFWTELGRGAYAGVPIAMGYVPVAFSFGVAATRAGFSGAEAALFSAVMYSGAGQFMAIALLAAGVPFLMAIVTLLAMALRHLVYGPSLLQAAGQPKLGKFAPLWGFGLTDEVFGAALGALAKPGARFSDGFMLGVALIAWASWSAGTWMGALAGGGSLDAYPVISDALRFMLPALFLALVLSMLSKELLPVIGAAAVGVLLGAWLFNGTIAILIGMALGALAGLLPKGKTL